MAAIRHKRSDTPGARTNLIPGQIAHNRADDVLLIRGGKRKLEIDLAKWRTNALPPPGMVGAPLALAAGAAEWDETLMPTGAVSGVVPVDPNDGAGAWAVPGAWHRQGTEGQLVTNLLAHDCLIERFYVASDAVKVSAIGFQIIDPTYSGIVKLAIIDDLTNTVLYERIVTGPWTGVTSVATNGLSLPRGYYRKLLWVDQDGVGLSRWSMSRYNTSFEIVGGAPSFTKYRTTNQDFTDTFDFDPTAPVLDVPTETPYEEHHIFLKWRLSNFTYEPETLALLDRMDPVPDHPRRVLIDQLVSDLKASGVWDQSDGLYVTAAHSEQAARLNWVGPDSLGGAGLFFQPDLGFTATQDDDSRYLIGSVPVKATPVDYHAAVWETAFVGWTPQAAQQPWAVQLLTEAWVFPATATGALRTRDFGDVAGAFETTAGGGDGYTVIGRLAPADPYTIYKDGAVLHRAGTLTGGYSSTSTHTHIQACGAGTLAVVHYGAGLTDDQVQAAQIAFQTYLDAIHTTAPRAAFQVTATPSPARADIVDAGVASTSISAHPTGGSGNYGYQWTAPTATVTNSTSAIATFSKPVTAGETLNETVSVRVSDLDTGVYWDLQVPVTFSSLTATVSPA